MKNQKIEKLSNGNYKITRFTEEEVSELELDRMEYNELKQIENAEAVIALANEKLKEIRKFKTSN